MNTVHVSPFLEAPYSRADAARQDCEVGKKNKKIFLLLLRSQVPLRRAVHRRGNSSVWDICPEQAVCSSTEIKKWSELSPVTSAATVHRINH